MSGRWRQEAVLHHMPAINGSQQDWHKCQPNVSYGLQACSRQLDGVDFASTKFEREEDENMTSRLPVQQQPLAQVWNLLLKNLPAIWCQLDTGHRLAIITPISDGVVFSTRSHPQQDKMALKYMLGTVAQWRFCKSNLYAHIAIFTTQFLLFCGVPAHNVRS